MERPTRLAYRYAKALIELAKEREELSAIRKDLALVATLLEEIPELKAFLQDPTVSKAEKKKILEEVFQPRVSPLFYHFLLLLNRKHRDALLSEILLAVQRLEEMAEGKERVLIQTAVALEATEQQELVQRLEQFVGKQLIPTFEVDPELLGGFIARFEDRVLDASIRYQLRRLRQQLQEQLRNGAVKT